MDCVGHGFDIFDFGIQVLRCLVFLYYFLHTVSWENA